MICPNCNFVGRDDDITKPCPNCNFIIDPREQSMTEDTQDFIGIHIGHAGGEEISVYGPKEIFSKLFDDIWNQIKKAPNPDTICVAVCGFNKDTNGNISGELKVIVHWKHIATLLLHV